MSLAYCYDPANPHRESVLTNLCTFLRTQGRKLMIQVKEPTRSLEQNARMWALLTDIAEQLEWPVDGKMQFLEPEEWKDILTAGLHKEQRVAQGIAGGFVLLGRRTSKMTKAEMSDLMALIEAFGSERNVRWGDLEAA